MRRLLLFPLTAFSMIVLLLGLLLASNLYTYYRLTDEAPIAELHFRKLGEQRYEALLAYGDFCHEQSFRLDGDEFRLDARFLKWRPWANLLGFDALYRIERLGGRYVDAQRENSNPPTVYALNPEPRLDLAAVLARYPGQFSPVDTLYGSSVYDVMDAAHLYRVYRGQSGLLVRKTTLPAATGLTIEIRRACGEPHGFWRRALDWLGNANHRDAAAGPGS